MFCTSARAKIEARRLLCAQDHIYVVRPTRDPVPTQFGTFGGLLDPAGDIFSFAISIVWPTVCPPYGGFVLRNLVLQLLQVSFLLTNFTHPHTHTATTHCSCTCGWEQQVSHLCGDE